MAEVRTIAVIGAGAVGRGIAHAAALGGYRTILEDVLPNALRRAAGEIRSTLDQAVSLGAVSAEAASTALTRLRYADSVDEAAREADLVIEDVPEELESKIEIFTLLDKICRPGTMLASNTASFSISEIAGVTYRAPKIVGMRFSRAGRLEIVQGAETDAETMTAAAEVGRRMGREVAVVPDYVSAS